jgi:hypothetical protein
MGAPIWGLKRPLGVDAWRRFKVGQPICPKLFLSFSFCKSENYLNLKTFKFEYIQIQNYANSKSIQIQKAD